MRPLDELLQFLNSKMSMTEIYQPVIIRYLLEQDGTATKTELAQVLSGYDESVQEYYQKVLMRYPKATLTKHEIISYSKENKAFQLNFELNSGQDLQKAKAICEEKILDWIKKRSTGSASSSQLASKRYRILKAARGKCELCGISAKISPIDIDHIVPQSKADKHRKIVKDDISRELLTCVTQCDSAL